MYVLVFMINIDVVLGIIELKSSGSFSFSQITKTGLRKFHITSSFFMDKWRGIMLYTETFFHVAFFLNILTYLNIYYMNIFHTDTFSSSPALLQISSSTVK